MKDKMTSRVIRSGKIWTGRSFVGFFYSENIVKGKIHLRVDIRSLLVWGILFSIVGMTCTTDVSTLHSTIDLNSNSFRAKYSMNMSDYFNRWNDVFAPPTLWCSIWWLIIMTWVEGTNISILNKVDNFKCCLLMNHTTHISIISISRHLMFFINDLILALWIDVKCGDDACHFNTFEKKCMI